jgi:integrase/recombinase XerC
MTTELATLTPLISDPVPVNPALLSTDLLGLILTGLKPQSAAAYHKDFDIFARFVGSTSAEDALWALIRLPSGDANALALAFQADMSSRKLSAAVIARRLAALRRAVKRARLVGLTTLNLEIDPPHAEAFRDCRGPGAAGWERLLDLAESDTLTGTAKGARDLALLLLLHDRALRRGEAIAIDFPEDVDLQRPAVQILGKGKASKLWLTINERTRLAIQSWIQIRGDWPGPLFVRSDPAARSPDRLTGDSVNRMVQTLATRAGLTRVIRAHGLRHQAITEALDGGWDVRDVKAFSRHGKIDTVMIYDDRRKDVGGDITRAIGGRRGKRRSAGKSSFPGAST